MLYSKLGSIPKTDTDGTENWVEVGYPPNPVAEGYEVVWWSPPGWVVRPIKPDTTSDTDFAWSQSTEQWVEYRLDGASLFTTEMPSLTTQQINLL